MKKTILLAFLLSLPAGAATKEISTPRTVKPAIQLNQIPAIKKYLLNLVGEYEQTKAVKEGSPVKASEAEVSLEFGNSDTSTCYLNRTRDRYLCEVVYLVDRWNGEALLEFEIKNGKLVKLLKADFSGNF